MQQWVALFRGINVGGHNRLPMKDLVTLLEALGCESVTTYIQSGNAIFQHPGNVSGELSGDIAQQVSEQFGFAPDVFLMTVDDLANCVADNPFAGSGADPKTLHLSFLTERALNPNLERMKALLADGEDFALTDQCFYLYAPNGIGRSKLAAQVEKLLGVSATARNWRTVNKLLAMAQEPAQASS